MARLTRSAAMPSIGCQEFFMDGFHMPLSSVQRDCSQHLRVFLPLENQFCSQQGSGLILGEAGAAHDILNELAPER